MNIDWSFPLSNGGSYDGFNDAGIETFSGAPFDGLAREIIQNSLDAAIDDQAKVTVAFDFIEIPKQDFPGQESLLKVMKQCQKNSKDKTKEKTFFRNAVNELQKSQIACLKISDYGTAGLRGDYRKHKGSWHAITKGRGVTDKKDETAGGSYGIGKSAPFTVSNLRTVFYSTLYEEDGVIVYRAQGKSILMSHSIGDDDYTQSTGFYGEKERCMPIENGDVPEFLRPKEQGCVIFITGFVAQDRWQDVITATVISNFFYAIQQKKLEVLVNDDKENIRIIDKGHLPQYFNELKDQKDISDKVNNSWNYYQAIESSASNDAELPNLGHCKMWVQVAEGLPKSVALLRKTGMLITDDQRGLKRWAGRTDFVGVFLCDSDKGNRLLREMENPQHNAFEPERASSELKTQCKKALKELTDWVRQVVDTLAKAEETEVTTIDELADLFPDTDSPETITGDESEQDIEGKPIYSPKPLKRSKTGSRVPDNETGEEGGSEERQGENGGNGTGKRSYKQSVAIQNVRVVSKNGSNTEKMVYFTPMESGKLEVALAVMGDDGATEPISVTKADGLCETVVHVTAQKGKRISLQMTLKNPETDSIAVQVSQTETKNSTNETTTK